MKKGEIVQGTVEKVLFPNKGIVVLPEGEQIQVKNVLEGQEVSVRVSKKRKGRAEGNLQEILTPSPAEIESSCPHFGVCGGCNYQSLPYKEQLKLKEKQVRDLLEPVLNKQDKRPVYDSIHPSPLQKGYRNKMEFSFGDAMKDGPLELGMHKRGSFYDIVTVTDCQIIDEDYRQILVTVRDFARSQEMSFFHRLRHTGYLRHLLVRKASRTGEILIALVTTTQEEHDLRPMVDQLLALPLAGKIIGILQIYNDSVADAIKNEGQKSLYGIDYFYEELLGMRFKITPFSFFQTNSLGAEVLYNVAREYIGQTGSDAEGNPTHTIFDLYSGTGTIAQMMAPVAKKVIGVEIVPEAVEAAKENAALNGLTNCEFIAGDVLKVIGDIQDKPDLIILDPPRDGIHPKALRQIIDYGVDRIVYISCKPTSLARDLEMFVDLGYEAKRVATVDMFPGTVHVETVVLLSKGDIDKGNSERSVAVKAGEGRRINGYSKENKAPETMNVKVDFSLEDLNLSELKGKATYEQIKDFVREQTGFRVSSLYISQVKRKCGLEVGESYNKPKSEDSRQPQCTPEKEEAIMQALRHYGII